MKKKRTWLTDFAGRDRGECTICIFGLAEFVAYLSLRVSGFAVRGLRTSLYGNLHRASERQVVAD